MKELNRTRRLIIATTLFVLVLAIGMLTLRKPDFEYQITTEEMLEELYNIENEMLPDEAMEIIAYADSSYIFVDLRNSYEYDKGSLENAINIPVSDILDEESMEFFEQMAVDSIILVLFGYNQREANGPWMMLKQLGFNNMKVLLGGYGYLADEDIDYYDLPEIPPYFVEEASMDFATFIEEAGNQPLETSNTEKISIKPVQRKKKIVAEGGC